MHCWWTDKPQTSEWVTESSPRQQYALWGAERQQPGEHRGMSACFNYHGEWVLIRTLEWLQDIFLSEQYCCHKTSCERAHSPQISCLKVSSILSYGNDLQRVAVSPCTHIHRLPSSSHQTSTQLDCSFTGFYDVGTKTLSFLQTCTFIWPKYPKMTFRLLSV